LNSEDRQKAVPVRDVPVALWEGKGDPWCRLILLLGSCFGHIVIGVIGPSDLHTLSPKRHVTN